GGSTSRERRPLSAWSPGTSVAATFQPALEVDRYMYSETVSKLSLDAAEAWQGAVESLLQAMEHGRSVIGVAGAEPCCGCTTTLICLARLLARRGLRIAVVDGDFRTAQLASEMGLAVEVGWEHVLGGRLPLAECVVVSLADEIALLPLVEGGVEYAEKLETVQASVTAGVLRYHFDLVLFDLGSLSVPTQAVASQRVARQCRLDGVVLVTNSASRNCGGLELLEACAPDLASVYLGDIANFVDQA
ncbi:MAG: hypothetical protein KDA61_17755, partial [Planctomycetales bacterium]|nr:hypothetical protein [Planctomycetales bacterium]